MIVRYHELARQEVIEITKYYAELRTGLESEFLQELDSALSIVEANPVLFEEIRPGYRCCMLKRFPYSVIYRIVDPQLVRVVVVRHHSRRPGHGMRRK
jgi:plasmid stabilization system protein ParE